MIDEGTILIDSDGMVVGQVNGLSVIIWGLYFGKPSDTVKTPWKGRDYQYEREAEMSGRLIIKVYILAGYLRGNMPG